MSSTSPWASSATPRACERRCGGARGAPTPRPSPLQLCRGPSTPAPRPAPRILRHQPGHRAIRLPSPPTAAWDKGTLGGGSPGPPFPRCGRRGPSWAGPGQLPSAGATAGAAQQGPLPSLALPQPRSSSPRCHGQQGEAEAVPGLPGGSPSCPHPPPKPALPQGAASWRHGLGAAGIFFYKILFFLNLLYGYFSGLILIN